MIPPQSPTTTSTGRVHPLANPTNPPGSTVTVAVDPCRLQLLSQRACSHTDRRYQRLCDPSVLDPRTIRHTHSICLYCVQYETYLTADSRPFCCCTSGPPRRKPHQPLPLNDKHIVVLGAAAALCATATHYAHVPSQASVWYAPRSAPGSGLLLDALLKLALPCCATRSHATNPFSWWYRVLLAMLPSLSEQ